MTENQNQTTTAAPETKFCKECGQKIAARAVVCPHCGCQVEEPVQQAAAAPQIVIQNTNTNTNTNVNAVPAGTPKNKWVALILWFFLGVVGGHKFYEGKVGMGIIYILTFGLFGIGTFIDFFVLLFKPTTYYV